MNLSRRAALVVAVLVAALVGPAAWAQAAETPADVEARVLYETAVRLQAEGKTDQAREALERIAERFPQSAYAKAAMEKLAGLGQGPSSLAPRLRAPNNPDPAEFGRWELVIGQTVYGAYYGLALANMVDGVGDEAVMWSTIGGALASLGTTVLATRDLRLHDGYSHLHLSFQTYAVINTALLLATAEVQEEDAYLGGTVAAGLAGAGAAMALGERLDIPRGQAEMITGAGLFGFWTGLALTVMAAPSDIDHAAAVTVPVLLAGDLGLALGAVAAPRLRWGKWRVRLVEMGAVLGGGLGLATAISADVADARTGVGITYGASLLGGLIAAIATSGFNTGSDGGGGPATALVPTALPGPDGRSAPGISLAGQFW